MESRLFNGIEGPEKGLIGFTLEVPSPHYGQLWPNGDWSLPSYPGLATKDLTLIFILPGGHWQSLLEGSLRGFARGLQSGPGSAAPGLGIIADLLQC